MPLLPAMAKSMQSKLHKLLNGELEPLLSELSSSNDALEKFSAINHLLSVDKKTYFCDILIYLECSTIKGMRFLVTNDNKFYQNVAKRGDVLEIVRLAAKQAVRSYNKRHKTNFLYNFYPVPVVPLTDMIIIHDFSVAYMKRRVEKIR